MQLNEYVIKPRSNKYQEILRFLVQASPPDSPNLKFLVTLWSYSLKYDGLSERQIQALEPYLAAIRELVPQGGE